MSRLLILSPVLVSATHGAIAGVVEFRISLSLGARLSPASDYPLHRSRRPKFTWGATRSTELPETQNPGSRLFDVGSS